MNPVIKVAIATVETCIWLIALALPHTETLTEWVWYVLAIMLAFLLRIGIEINNNTLTRKRVLVQSIYTLCYCFLAVIVWRDFLKYDKGFEVYLFINSLFAVFIVGQLEKAFELGFKAYARKALRSFLAVEPPTKENEKHDA